MKAGENVRRAESEGTIMIHGTNVVRCTMRHSCAYMNSYIHTSERVRKILMKSLSAEKPMSVRQVLVGWVVGGNGHGGKDEGWRSRKIPETIAFSHM